jgi:hypothetical protein
MLYQDKMILDGRTLRFSGGAQRRPLQPIMF